jgi:CDP-glucose 4,6-dehydratase
MAEQNTNISASFWQSKRVLLSGHTGFKGGWLSLWLQSMGAEICGVALAPPTEPSLFNQVKISDGIRNEIVDIRNFVELDKVFQSFRPEIVIHMAAQPLVRLSYLEPIQTYQTNVMGTVHILEASRNAKSVRAIVNVTTDKCYENQEWAWGYREYEPMGGHDPYSSSKGCSEIISSAYSRSFLEAEGIAIATARAGNVIGGGDWAQDRLIPDVIKSLERKDVLKIRNPNAIRPWQHVLEPLSGYMILAEMLYNNKKSVSGAWNFGPHDEDAKTVRWIVENLSRKWGTIIDPEFDSSKQPHEAHFLKLDISKAKQQLGWKPRWSLDTALDKIIFWQKAYLKGEDMRSICINQISEYTRKEQL